MPVLLTLPPDVMSLIALSSLHFNLLKAFPVSLTIGDHNQSLI